jgi:cellulose synthase/poly-beta-1,6-N-acetylglucosamine synthase-like glycosyltransferase
MVVFQVLFWFIAFMLFWIYFGYVLFLRIASLFKANRVPPPADVPPASLIIAAYNEEPVIGDRIENSFELDYPEDKLEIIVFSDASSDRTDEIVERYAEKGIKLLRIEGRKGKTHCQNEGVKIATGEIIVFSDANSMYESDAILRLVCHFADQQVGCVSGELRYRGGETEVEGEKAYWRYEQIVKQLESNIASLVTANGAIYAVRKSLYDPLRGDAISDFVEPLKIVQKGYKVLYEPEAVAWETTAGATEKEFRRRVRIVARSFHSILRDSSLLALLNPFRYGIFSLQLWSHKILRWFSGFFMVLSFALNILLIGHGWFYGVIMTGQAAFYLLALWGLVSEALLNRRAPKLGHVAYYFCLSCYAMLIGVFLALRGRTIVTWKPSR